MRISGDPGGRAAAEIERSRLMSTDISRSASNSMGRRTTGRPLNIGPSTTRICVSMIMPSPAVRLGIPVMSTPIATRRWRRRRYRPEVISASSVNEDSGIDPLRFCRLGSCWSKVCGHQWSLPKCDITPRRCLRQRVIAKSCIGCSWRAGPHHGASQTRAMLTCRVKPQDTNGEIAGATSVPGPVLVCMREVMAKGALYFSAVWVKGFAQFRATITKPGNFMITVGPYGPAWPTENGFRFLPAEPSVAWLIRERG